MTTEPEGNPPGELPEARTPAPEGAANGWSLGACLLLFVGFVVVSLAIYRPALEGEFVSDDIEYLVKNPFVNSLSLENLAAVFDFRSSEKSFTGNYAPVDEVMMAFERHYFGDNVVPYHVLNVAVHAGVAVLLIVWFSQAGLPAAAALVGGTVFLLHPANSEAVAWMSQLKTLSALFFSLAALIAFRARPALATVFFGTALLTKASALFALPTLAALVWARSATRTSDEKRWAWVAVWAAACGLYAIPEFASFSLFGATESPYPDARVHLQSMLSYFSRYFVMATTSFGLSAFHEPDPTTSIGDPWFLASLPIVLLLGWRIVATLRRRSVEAAFWIAAVAGYAPTSQIFPFIFPMGDRYLYFVLPGLIGGALFIAVESYERLARPGEANAAKQRLAAHIALAAMVAICVFFGFRSHQRAAVWRDEVRLNIDAARHYPDGGPANLLRAQRAAQMGDVETAIAALEIAESRGLSNFMALPQNPALAPIAGSQAFHDFIREMAGRWIENSRGWASWNQSQYHMLAHAHMVRGEHLEAVQALEDAIAAGGPQDAVLAKELAELRMMGTN